MKISSLVFLKEATGSTLGYCTVGNSNLKGTLLWNQSKESLDFLNYFFSSFLPSNCSVFYLIDKKKIDRGNKAKSKIFPMSESGVKF